MGPARRGGSPLGAARRACVGGAAWWCPLAASRRDMTLGAAGVRVRSASRRAPTRAHTPVGSPPLYTMMTAVGENDSTTPRAEEAWDVQHECVGLCADGRGCQVAPCGGWGGVQSVSPALKGSSNNNFRQRRGEGGGRAATGWPGLLSSIPFPSHAHSATGSRWRAVLPGCTLIDRGAQVFAPQLCFFLRFMYTAAFDDDVCRRALSFCVACSAARVCGRSCCCFLWADRLRRATLKRASSCCGVLVCVHCPC